jgi:hypothetical protein
MKTDTNGTKQTTHKARKLHICIGIPINTRNTPQPHSSTLTTQRNPQRNTSTEGKGQHHNQRMNETERTSRETLDCPSSSRGRLSNGFTLLAFAPELPIFFVHSEKE